MNFLWFTVLFSLICGLFGLPISPQLESSPLGAEQPQNGLSLNSDPIVSVYRTMNSIAAEEGTNFENLLEMLQEVMEIKRRTIFENELSNKLVELNISLLEIPDSDLYVELGKCFAFRKPNVKKSADLIENNEQNRSAKSVFAELLYDVALRNGLSFQEAMNVYRFGKDAELKELMSAIQAFIANFNAILAEDVKVMQKMFQTLGVSDSDENKLGYSEASSDEELSFDGDSEELTNGMPRISTADPLIYTEEELFRSLLNAQSVTEAEPPTEVNLFGTEVSHGTTTEQDSPTTRADHSVKTDEGSNFDFLSDQLQLPEEGEGNSDSSTTNSYNKNLLYEDHTTKATKDPLIDMKDNFLRIYNLLGNFAEENNVTMEEVLELMDEDFLTRMVTGDGTSLAAPAENSMGKRESTQNTLEGTEDIDDSNLEIEKSGSETESEKDGNLSGAQNFETETSTAQDVLETSDNKIDDGTFANQGTTKLCNNTEPRITENSSILQEENSNNETETAEDNGEEPKEQLEMPVSNFNDYSQGVVEQNGEEIKEESDEAKSKTEFSQDLQNQFATVEKAESTTKSGGGSLEQIIKQMVKIYLKKILAATSSNQEVKINTQEEPIEAEKPPETLTKRPITNSTESISDELRTVPCIVGNKFKTAVDNKKQNSGEETDYADLKTILILGDGPITLQQLLFALAQLENHKEVVQARLEQNNKKPT